MAQTNQRHLELRRENELISNLTRIANSTVIPPVYIGKNVILQNTVVGMHVSIGENTEIKESRVSNPLIRENSYIVDGNIANSMIGNIVKLKGKSSDLSLGDYCIIEG